MLAGMPMEEQRLRLMEAKGAEKTVNTDKNLPPN